MDHKSVGGLLRTRREQLGLSQMQVAHAANMSQGDISRLENGLTPYLGVGRLTRIARALAVVVT